MSIRSKSSNIHPDTVRQIQHTDVISIFLSDPCGTNRNRKHNARRVLLNTSPQKECKVRRNWGGGGGGGRIERSKAERIVFLHWIQAWNVGDGKCSFPVGPERRRRRRRKAGGRRRSGRKEKGAEANRVPCPARGQRRSGHRPRVQRRHRPCKGLEDEDAEEGQSQAGIEASERMQGPSWTRNARKYPLSPLALIVIRPIAPFCFALPSLPFSPAPYALVQAQALAIGGLVCSDVPEPILWNVVAPPAVDLTGVCFGLEVRQLDRVGEAVGVSSMAGLGIKAVNARPEAKVCLTGMESESLLRSVMPALPMFRKGISSARKAADATTKMKLRGSYQNDRPSEKPRSFFAGISTSMKCRITPNPISTHVCRADSLDTIQETSNLDNGTINGIWERVQLLERQLGVAVTEENYVEASRIRDQLTSLKSKLTPGEQFLLTYSARSRSGSLGQRMTALAAMGELGDHRALPVLLEGLRDNNPLVVEQTEKAMWKIFMRSGREDIDRKLQDGIDLLMTKDGYRKAKNILTEIITEAPSFAEGFNKRATVNYLLEEYDEAIKDCHSTLQLNPYHFGALSGMGLCYAARRELEAALFWFEKALALHPGLHLIGKYIEALKQKIAHRKGNVEGDHK